VYASSDDDVLHALDISTGTERWRFSPVNPPVSAPAVADGVVYAFDGVGTLFALDAASGNIRWQAAAPLKSPSNPTVRDGNIYVSSGDGAVVALDVATGAERWRYELAGGGASHNPSVADGIVYAGSDSGGLVALDAATGSLLWHFDTGTDLTGSVVVAEGTAYIGGTGESVTGHMSALDAKSGNLKWQLDRPFLAPAVADGVAYSSNQVDGTQAVDAATGTKLWAVPSERATLSVSQGVVYVPVNTGRRIDALDAATGRELWHFDVDGGNSCCVAIAHGSVFVATESGSVYDIGGDGSTISPGRSTTPLPSPSASPSASPTASPAAFPPPVEFVWSAIGGGEGLRGAGPIAIDPKGSLWVADTANSRFAIFDPDGNFVEYWEHRGSGRGEFLLQRSNGDGYGQLVFAPDGSFYVLDVGNHRVEQFAKDRSFIKAWGGFGSAPGTYTDPIGLAVDAQGVVYVLDDVRGVIERYDKDGKVLGSIDSNPSKPPGFNTANSLSLDGQGNYYVSACCSAGNYVQKLDPSGVLLTTYGAAGSGAGQFTDQPGSMGIDATGRLFVTQGGQATGGKIEIFDAAGSFLASFGPPGTSNGQFRFATGVILDGAGYIYVADASINRIQKFRLLPPFAP
jgi:outer membrane protein assembly factor BamB